MTQRQAGNLVIVYEAVNHTLREIYIGTTTHLLHHVADDLERNPPPEISRWSPHHRIEYRAIDWSMPARYAPRFMRACAQACPAGWRAVAAGDPYALA